MLYIEILPGTRETKNLTCKYKPVFVFLIDIHFGFKLQLQHSTKESQQTYILLSVFTWLHLLISKCLFDIPSPVL